MIKKIFIFTLVLLPLQYVMVGVIGYYKSEPWPALVLPAFKSVYATGERITVNQMQLYAQNIQKGTTHRINPEILFDDVNGSQRQGLYRTHFSDSAAVARLDQESRLWLKERIEMLYPGIQADRVNIQWVKRSYPAAISDTGEYQIEPSTQLSIKLVK